MNVLKMKNKLKFRILKIFVIGVVTVLAFNFTSPKFLNDPTAYAIGDLTVDWGIGTGDVGPIFNVTNMAPGDMVSHSVIVTNNASTARPVGVRGIKTTETGDLSTVLDIVISDPVSELYGGASPTGPKTLSQFFTESGGMDGIPLSVLAPSHTTTYTFKVTFQDSAGNDFQGASVMFNLKIGIAIHVPDECKDIQFSGDPIFGTENRDVLNGTNGNDLIFSFEGNDVVNASNGDDCIVGGAGNDILHGSNGRDVILGEGGNDRIDGSNGDDVLIGGDGNDVIDGSNGDDQINGGEGNDKILASNGNDQITGGPGNDDIDAGNGDDNVIAGPGNDKVDAGNGNDYIQGNEGNDMLLGRNGNDTLLGGADTDVARGDLGSDTCEAETEISCEIQLTH